MSLQRLAKFGLRFVFNAFVGMLFLIFGMGYRPYTNDFSFSDGFGDMLNFLGGLGSFWAWVILMICAALMIWVLYMLYRNDYEGNRVKIGVHIIVAIVTTVVCVGAIYFLWQVSPSNVGWWALGFVAFTGFVTWIESLDFFNRTRTTTP